MKLVIFLLVVLQLWSQFGVDGLYFHIRETEKKCFIEEVPDETLVVGKLIRSRFLNLPKLGLFNKCFLF